MSRWVINREVEIVFCKVGGWSCFIRFDLGLGTVFSVISILIVFFSIRWCWLCFTIF